MAEVLVAGETLVDLIPAGSGSLRDVEGFSHRPGGAPANVAVGLARLGRTPNFWTRLASDSFGTYLRGVLQENGIPDAHVRRVDAGTTTLAVVSPDPEAERRFEFYGADRGTFDFRAANVPEDAVGSCSWVHFGGVALVDPRGARAMLELAERARAEGCTVSFDPNLRPALLSTSENESRVVESVSRVLELTDVVLCSPADFAAIDDRRLAASELARDLLGRGPHTAFVTTGADGAIARATGAAPWGKQDCRHPGFPVDVVDDTGAGDSFAAAVVSRLVAEGPSGLRPVLRFANAAAALTTTDRGGLSSMPDQDAVKRFLADSVK